MTAIANTTASTNPLENYTIYDPNYVPLPMGFTNNTGSICWGNSFIQLMLSIPSFNKTLLECENDLLGNNLAMECIKLIKSQLSGEESDASPTTVLNAMIYQSKIKKINLDMSTSRQDCVDTAFTAFIELLDCKKIELLFNNVYQLTIVCERCSEVAVQTRDKAFRIPIFTTFPLDTEAEFTMFLRVHPSEVDVYKCDKCGHTMKMVYREEKLKMVREVIVIIFNKYYDKKLNWFPQELHINSNNGKTLNYKLIGKVEHSGSLNSGHYWASVKRRDTDNTSPVYQNWYELNDGSAKPGNSNPTSNTFMIAYHMVEPTQRGQIKAVNNQ